MIPALVLTAGLGTRLDPITRVVAKPAVPLGERTILEWTLDWLRRQGVRDVVLNLHHLPATIAQIVGDGRHLGLSVRYSWEPRLLGSAGGPRHALALFESDAFLIANGDTLCDVALDGMLQAHRASAAKVTMAVVPHPAPEKYNGVLLSDDDQHIVRSFVPRGSAGHAWHFVGVQIVHRSVFVGLPDDVPAETVAGLYRELLGSSPGSIRAWRMEGTAVDIGTPRDYLDAALDYRHRADVTNDHSCVVWPTAAVDPGADLARCIVLGGVTVPAGFRAYEAVLAPASILQPGDRARVSGNIAIFPF